MGELPLELELLMESAQIQIGENLRQQTLTLTLVWEHTCNLFSLLVGEK